MGRGWLHPLPVTPPSDAKGAIPPQANPGVSRLVAASRPGVAMRTLSLVALLALLGSSGLVLATPAGGSDESAFHLDLRSAKAGVYYIKCENGRNLGNCAWPSLWQDSNDVDGLQSWVYYTENVRHERDDNLLA